MIVFSPLKVHVTRAVYKIKDWSFITMYTALWVLLYYISIVIDCLTDGCL